MNILQMVTGGVTAVGALTGLAWTGVTEVRNVRDEAIAEVRQLEQRSEERYVPLSEWQDFQWTQLKRELRELEKDLAEAEFSGNDEFAELLEERYAELVEFICRKYPADREC